MSPRGKLVIGAYLSGVVTYQLLSTYNAGKNALLYVRNENNNVTPTEEWRAVTVACKEGTCVRFWDSLVWPATIASHLLPKAVIALNPRIEI